MAAAGVLLAAAPGSAQHATGVHARPPESWPHSPPPAGTLVTTAERVLRDGALVVLEGYAQVAYGTTRVQADRIEIREDELAIVAEGNVVFERGNEKVVAESLTANLNARSAKFVNARGVLGQDFHFVAETMEEIGNGDVIIERGAFTTCSQPTPRWNFTATRAVVRPQQRVWLRNVSFRVKNVPFLYLPFLYYPLRKNQDERKTGFLMPRYSNSDVRGHLVSQSFYWAINRSMDATLSVDHYTKAGTGYGVEYRHRGEVGSKADAEAFLISDKITESREYSLKFDVAQRLPGRFRLSARGDMFSSFDFSQRFQNSFAGSTRRFKRLKGDLKGRLFRHRIGVRFDRKETQYSARTSLREALPQFNVTRRNLNLFGEYVQIGYELDYLRAAKSYRDEVHEWSRIFIGPKLGLSLPTVPFLDLNLGVEAGYVRYTGSEDPETGDFDPELGLAQRFYGGDVQAIGPTVERIFESPNNFYAARYKHLIEPEVTWDYRVSGDGFDLVKRHDRRDRYPTTNEVSFGLVNRVLAKRYRDGVEESTATDLITWRILQSYFFLPEAGAYNSRYVSSSFQDEQTVQKSPIRSDFRFQPDQSVNGDWTMEWDPDERVFTSIRVGTRVGDYRSNRQFSFNWSRRARRIEATDDEPEKIDANSYLRGQADFITGELVRTGVSVNYDLTERRLSNLSVRADILFQCCGVNVEWTRFNLASRSENIFRFGISIGGLYSFGFGAGGGQDNIY